MELSEGLARNITSRGPALGNISLISAGEAMLACNGSGPAMALPPCSVVALIAAQAERTPDHTAVTDHAVRWTYAELMAAASATLSRLQRLVVTRGEHIGVMLEPGAPMLATLLGVLAAGATYVPLDPALSPDRLAPIIKDAGLHLVLSDKALRPQWPANVPVCCIDDARPIRPLPALPVIDPSSAAYMLYTSGSTGLKGVRVSNRSLVNLLLAMQGELPISAHDVLLAATSTSFDVAALELFLPLTLGAQVAICDRPTAADPHALARHIAATGATWMQATPSTWRMLMDVGWIGKADLNVLCGGEALSPQLADALLARVHSLRNLYGHTETTIWSTCGKVRAGAPIDLGRPLANTELYVLDESQRLVPPGTIGELYIGGVGVAMGYWQRPELTQERFFHGLSVAQDDTLYRTSDRVRWTADGRLAHHGRCNYQTELSGPVSEIVHVLA
jgi:amino acid adenylation domain-containing protein